MARHYSHIRDTREANAAALDIVRSILPQSTRLFSSCNLVSRAIAQLRPPCQNRTKHAPGQQQQRVGIVTCPRAIREYDPVHPERIAFILVRAHPPPQYMVFTNDRQLDAERIVRFWLTSNAYDLERSTTTTECVVCSHNLIPMPKGADEEEDRFSTRRYLLGKPHSRCIYCHSLLCEPCGDRLTTFDGCHRCPVCRQWKLVGGDFGVPFTESAIDHPDTGAANGRNKGDPVDVLCDRVLSRLDGRIDVVPRIADGFIIDRMEVIAKLSRTDRYCPDTEENGDDCVRISHVRRNLKRILSVASGAPVHVWLRRKTYMIDDAEEKPVEEAAVFYIREGRHLQQLHPDAWVDVLGEVMQDVRGVAAERAAEMIREMASMVADDDEREKVMAEAEDEAKHEMDKTAWAFTTRKVAYLPPHEFSFPSALREATAAAASKVKAEEGSEGSEATVVNVAVSLLPSTTDGGEMGMSYGADQNGDPTTATIPFLAARFWVLVDATRAAAASTASTEKRRQVELSAVVAPNIITARKGGEQVFKCNVSEDDAVSLQPIADLV